MFTAFVLLCVWVAVFTVLYFKVEDGVDDPRSVKSWFRFITVPAVIFTIAMIWIGIQWSLECIEDYIERKRKKA